MVENFLAIGIALIGVTVLIDALWWRTEGATLLRPSTKELEARQDVPSLMKKLKDDNRAVRRGALEALVRIGEPSVEPLVAALNDWMLADRAAKGLGRIGDVRAVQPLVDLLELNSRGSLSGTRPNAIEALGELGDVRANSVLLAALSSHEREQAKGALQKLGQRHSATVDALADALGSADIETREGAAEVLEAIGWQPRNDAQRANFAVALQRWDDAALLGVVSREPLLVSLNHTQPAVRLAAATTLVSINAADQRVIESLLEVLRSKQPFEVRFSAYAALEKVGKEAIPQQDVHDLVTGIATEIRLLYSKTRSVVIGGHYEEVWASDGGGGLMQFGEKYVPDYDEEPAPDVDGITRLIARIPISLHDKVRALSGSADYLFANDDNH